MPPIQFNSETKFERSAQYPAFTERQSQLLNAFREDRYDGLLAQMLAFAKEDLEEYKRIGKTKRKRETEDITELREKNRGWFFPRDLPLNSLSFITYTTAPLVSRDL
ncbi:hypothetical protein BGAL_0020g00310 [Botrytis galanthina]|uniref:Uncharacterized protein n=1 Tax=Botrytis galanthina TaxID=278940 RepID=A0A4S8R9K7_9HELO|nr:hypothetical protein BGAL_0020g00310 [Botrytis galanthina]